MGINQVSPCDVSEFLAKAKKLMVAGKYVFVPRDKNMQALVNHGLTIADSKSEMLDVLERIDVKFKDFGSVDISNYSHKEKGYNYTKKGEIISYSYAKDIFL